jgi:hypothetical protein
VDCRRNTGRGRGDVARDKKKIEKELEGVLAAEEALARGVV